MTLDKHIKQENQERGGVTMMTLGEYINQERELFLEECTTKGLEDVPKYTDFVIQNGRVFCDVNKIYPRVLITDEDRAEIIRAREWADCVIEADNKYNQSDIESGNDDYDDDYRLLTEAQMIREVESYFGTDSEEHKQALGMQKRNEEMKILYDELSVSLDIEDYVQNVKTHYGEVSKEYQDALELQSNTEKMIKLYKEINNEV